VASDQADDAQGDDAQGDDAQGDDAVQYEDDYVNEADYIKYWTTYALLPKRCIVYNNVDVIVYQVFENGYKQCNNEAMGTYITPAGTFVSAYMDQIYLEETDKGNDDYATPDAAQYTQCTNVEVQGNSYYVQVGCSDYSSQKLAVNIYSDETCETRVKTNGVDDSNIDISQLQLPFKSCQACVVWIDRDDDANIDDQYYENKRRYAPLCSQVWKRKETCDKTCQKTGVEPVVREGWNKSDKVLLGVLTFFAFGMMIGIIYQRRSMSNKEALLEQAAMTAVGLQQSHIIFIFVLTIIVVVIFASLCMKDITWTMLLVLNVTLFAYLLKLTVDNGNTCIMNPDGTIRRVDSDETSYTSTTSKKFVPPDVLSSNDPNSSTNVVAVPTPAQEGKTLV